MSYLADKLMAGAIVALDDPWQEEGFPFGTRGHYGQVPSSCGGHLNERYSPHAPVHLSIWCPVLDIQ